MNGAAVAAALVLLIDVAAAAECLRADVADHAPIVMQVSAVERR